MDQQKLYLKIAGDIKRLVESGTFRAGDRIPSIREMSRQAKASINTVKTAYGYLEDRLIIEARPQSGYYVVPPPAELPREPVVDHDEISPFEISPSKLVVRIMKDVLDPEMVQFGAAIPDPALTPSLKLSRILSSQSRLHRGNSTAYVTAPGNRRLRYQIARLMQKAGCILSPEELIITNGASEAVFLALQALCKPGDAVAVSSPIYFNFVEMFTLLGLRVVEIPNSPKNGLSLQALAHVLENNSIACCLVVTNFDNPMGNSLSDQEKEQLVQLLKHHQTPLIEDDINGDLSHDELRPSVAKAWDRSGMVLLCSSFSKTLAPGYRVGWIAPGKFFEDLLHRKLVANIATATPTQMAIAEFLENGGYSHHLRSIGKAYGNKLARMSEAIRRYFPPGTRLTRPKGGFALWVELPGEADTTALYAAAIQEKITFAPGRIFSTDGRFQHCLRLNGAFWSEENSWAIARLGEMTTNLLKS